MLEMATLKNPELQGKQFSAQAGVVNMGIANRLDGSDDSSTHRSLTTNPHLFLFVGPSLTLMPTLTP